MKITVNGEVKTLAARTLADALRELGYGKAKVATAVNEDFVPTGLRTATLLSDGDRLEVVAPRQGG